MDFLDDFFQTEEWYVAEFQGRENTYTGNTITGVSYPVLGKVDALLWDSSLFQTTISDKYKEVVDSTLVFNYGDLSFEIISQANRVFVNNDYYSVLAKENIGNQNEITRVFLKKYEQE